MTLTKEQHKYLILLTDFRHNLHSGKIKFNTHQNLIACNLGIGRVSLINIKLESLKLPTIDYFDTLQNKKLEEIAPSINVFLYNKEI